MLPRVKINFASGAIGAVASSNDGCCGLLINGDPVTGKLELGKAYVLSSYDGLEALGVSESVNPELEKAVREFYAEASIGSQLWIMVVARTVEWADMVDVNEAYGKALLRAAQGEVRCLGVVYAPAENYTPTIDDGVNDELPQVIANAQALCEWATTELFAPLFALVEARDFDGKIADLADLTEMTNNRVGVLCCDSKTESKGAAIGIICGRVATVPVHHNIGRVKDGVLSPIAMYVGGVSASCVDLADLMYQKGYISVRAYVGRAGYFFTDDMLCTAVSDDYRTIANRRIVDKAYRVVYDTLLDELLDYVPVNTDGTMQSAIAKNWEIKVEQAIARAMTANGELSADVTDPNDKGVVCKVDTTTNVLATSTVKVSVKVRPFGYARYIDVNLGFNVKSE